MTRSFLGVPLMLRTLLALSLMLTIASTAGIGQTPRITVGRNVHVSNARPTEQHDEVLIAADPADPSHLLACSMYQAASGVWHWNSAVYTSLDGGRTWANTLSDSIGGSDPACAYGPDGRAYFSALSPHVYYSADAGRTWTFTKLPYVRGPDRDYIVVDNTNGKYRGRVYFYAQMNGEELSGNPLPMAISLWRSVDGGKTFDHAVQRYPEGESRPFERFAFHPGTSVVMSDGTWAAVINQLSTDKRNDRLPGGQIGPATEVNSRIRFISSSDGGETLNDAVTVSNAQSDWRSPAGTIPTLAVDASHGPFKDRLYVVFADGRYGGRDQVLLSFSDDHGKSWSTPRFVNDDLRHHDTGELERNVGLVSVAVNKDGVVGVTWQDRRDNTADDESRDIRFAVSVDGGETFSSSVKVSEKPSVFGRDERWTVTGRRAAGVDGPSFEMQRQEWSTGGHTMGSTADANGVFHPLWVDNRTRVHQMWTAPITVEAQVARFGSKDLATLEDLSKKVDIEFVGGKYDQAARRATAIVRLRNKSRDTMTGPFKLRALAILSEASTSGTAPAINADNDMAGAGAVWDFTNLVDSGLLLPGATSRTKTLVFVLPGIRPIKKGQAFAWGMPYPTDVVHFEGQVLGRSSGRK